MENGELGLVILDVVSHVEVVHLAEHGSATTQVHQVTETTVMDPLMNPRDATLMIALVG